MTLQADGVDFGFSEQFGIVAAMGSVAGYTTRLLNCLVLVHPGTGHFGVALEAGRNLLSDSGLQLRFENCVRVMARGTFDGTVVGFVMNRRVECGFCCGVAPIAESRLGSFQQLCFFAGMN